MINQEVFNAVWNGLKSQGFERSGWGGSCKYRGPDGKKCAAGWLMTDEEYRPSFEGRSADYLEVGDLFKSKGIDTSFLMELQAVHDVNNTPVKMERALREFANEQKLTVPNE